MPKLVTVDAQTLAGNPWLKTKSLLTADNQISVPDWVAMDADGGVAFYISQLVGMEQTIYETPYADITYLEDIPVASGIPEYATHWNYRSYDGVTMGKFIGANAKDLPRVAQSAQLHQVEIGYAGVECHYTLDELRTTAATNMPIDTMQSELAYRGSEEHSQRVAYFGDADRKMDGLFNNPNVTGTAATIDYKVATGQQLFNLLNDPIFAVIKASKRYHTPNTVLMFPDLWKQANSTLMTGYTDRTVMEHFKINNSFTLLTGRELEIKIRFQLQATDLADGGVDNGGKDRYMVYDYSDRNLGLAKPIPFRMLAPQLEGLGITVPCEYKTSGTEFRYPLAAMYVDML